MFILFNLTPYRVSMTRYAIRHRASQGHSFALCLIHDVDRASKTYQGLFHALRDLSPRAPVLSLGLDAWVGSPGELYEPGKITEAVDPTESDVVH